MFRSPRALTRLKAKQKHSVHGEDVEGLAEFDKTVACTERCIENLGDPI